MTLDRGLIREWLWDWDPLGPEDPFDPHIAKGEYDWLIDTLAQDLEAQRTPDEIASHLTQAVRERYGLDADSDALVPRVRELLERTRTA